jgi:hypothetical protein
VLDCTAVTALPYPHLERATAALCAQLRRQLAAGEFADSSTPAVEGRDQAVHRQAPCWVRHARVIWVRLAGLLQWRRLPSPRAPETVEALVSDLTRASTGEGK